MGSSGLWLKMEGLELFDLECAGSENMPRQLIPLERSVVTSVSNMLSPSTYSWNQDRVQASERCALC